MSSRPIARPLRHAQHLLPHRLLPLREQCEQIERPGERLRGCLVPGHQEGHDIVDDESIGHGLAGRGVSCRDEPAEQVVTLARALANLRQHPRGDVAHRSARSRHHARAGMGDRRRQSERGERDLPHRMTEKRGAGLLDASAIRLAEAGAEHAVLQRLQGGARHVPVDGLARAGRRLAPTLQHGAASAGEGGNVGEHVLGPEQRRGQSALPAPRLALRVEQPAADRLAKHVVVERLLRIAVGVVQQHALNERGVHDEGALQPQPPVENELLPVEILAPASDRVADHLQDEPREGEAPLWRDRPLRYGCRPAHDAWLHDTIWPVLRISCKQGSRPIKVLNALILPILFSFRLMGSCE